MANFWDGKKVLVTGGAGFIGSHLVEDLLRRSKTVKVSVADNLSHGRKENLAAVIDKIAWDPKPDFSDLKDCEKVCEGKDVVLNLAARVAGVGYNAAHHGTMFRENMAIASNMLEAARRAKVERFLIVSSACVYSRDCVVPTPEDQGFRDSPEATNEGYGWAKRMAEYMAQAYHGEFGMKIAIARPYNVYGPRDHFESADNHVIAALIKKTLSGMDPIEVWGDGSSSRAFLFVSDMARGLLDVAERYAECDPVNLGTDEEITIADLAALIARVAGSKAKLKFDPSKPSGQPRRNCDTRKCKEKVGFEARVRLEEGLKKTIDWYRANGGLRMTNRSSNR